MRNAVSQAGRAADTAANTGANLGGDATAISGNLTPFLTEEMLHPQGYGQQGLSAMTAAAAEGTGGTASGLTGEAENRAAVSHNSGGAMGALDSIARERMRGNADASEGIVAKNADLMQQQQQEGAKGLDDLYGTDTGGMLKAQGQIGEDVNAQVNAGNSGWLQNTMNVIKTLNGGK